MEKHVVVVVDPSGSYVEPGSLLVGAGDTVVYHTLPRAQTVTLVFPEPIFKGVDATLVVKGSTEPLTVAQRPGVYEYGAYCKEPRGFAAGGSFPKVIIYG